MQVCLRVTDLRGLLFVESDGIAVRLVFVQKTAQLTTIHELKYDTDVWQ